MNTRKRVKLKLQNNLVVTTSVFKTEVTTSFSLEKMKTLLEKGYRVKDLLTKCNILPTDLIELYKFENYLNSINNKKQIISTIDNKTHELSFIVKKNEYEESLLDIISKEIKGLFGSNRNLRNFAIISNR